MSLQMISESVDFVDEDAPGIVEVSKDDLRAVRVQTQEALGHMCAKCLVEAHVNRVRELIEEYPLPEDLASLADESDVRAPSHAHEWDAAEQENADIEKKEAAVEAALAGHKLLAAADVHRELKAHAQILGWDELMAKLSELDANFPDAEPETPPTSIRVLPTFDDQSDLEIDVMQLTSLQEEGESLTDSSEGVETPEPTSRTNVSPLARFADPDGLAQDQVIADYEKDFQGGNLAEEPGIDHGDEETSIDAALAAALAAEQNLEETLEIEDADLQSPEVEAPDADQEVKGELDQEEAEVGLDDVDVNVELPEIDLHAVEAEALELKGQDLDPDVVEVALDVDGLDMELPEVGVAEVESDDVGLEVEDLHDELAEPEGLGLDATVRDGLGIELEEHELVEADLEVETPHVHEEELVELSDEVIEHYRRLEPFAVGAVASDDSGRDAMLASNEERRTQMLERMKVMADYAQKQRLVEYRLSASEMAAAAAPTPKLPSMTGAASLTFRPTNIPATKGIENNNFRVYQPNGDPKKSAAMRLLQQTRTEEEERRRRMAGRSTPQTRTANKQAVSVAEPTVRTLEQKQAAAVEPVAVVLGCDGGCGGCNGCGTTHGAEQGHEASQPMFTAAEASQARAAAFADIGVTGPAFGPS